MGLAIPTTDPTDEHAFDTSILRGILQQLGGGSVTYTNRSGTITSGGAAQVLMALNTSRKGFLIQNQSTGDLWISSLGTAAATQPSLQLPAGSYYEPPINGVPTTAISIFGATTAQAFAAREW